MTVHVRSFDREKALETILFVSHHLQAPTLHSISKILYLADKRHLHDYGRLICGDRYVAMEYGPVPSAIYNMMKVADGRATIDVDWDGLIKDAFEVRCGRYLQPKREANAFLLSDSERICITKTVEQHGSKTFGQLTDITHDAAWKASGQNQSISVEAMASTLPKANELLDYLRSE